MFLSIIELLDCVIIFNVHVHVYPIRVLDARALVLRQFTVVVVASWCDCVGVNNHVPLILSIPIHVLFFL